MLTWVFDQGGPLLGYTHRGNHWTQYILDEVKKAEELGMYGPGSVASLQEDKAANLLIEAVGAYMSVPAGELLVRFFANGSDACDCAVRLARAETGRDSFISIGYHGSSQIFAHSPQRRGVPKKITEDRIDLAWGDSQGLSVAMTRPQACVIVEVPSDDSAAHSFLRYIRNLCDKNGALMILDEVVTGFRLALGGAAQLYDVEPDLTCYGKALTNGRPMAALVGPWGIMEMLADKVFFSNTYNGDPYNCAHLIGTLNTLDEFGDEIYGYIYETGRLLRNGFNELGIRCIGHPPRTAIMMEEQARRTFSARMVSQGVVVDRPNYISMAHGEREIKRTLKACYNAVASI